MAIRENGDFPTVFSLSMDNDIRAFMSGILLVSVFSKQGLSHTVAVLKHMWVCYGIIFKGSFRGSCLLSIGFCSLYASNGH